MDCSLPVVTHRVNCRRHGKQAINAKLPDDARAARFCSTNAFHSFKRDEFSNSGAVDENYHSKRRDYLKLLRKCLNKLETDKIQKLCVAAESNKKLFFETPERSAFYYPNEWISNRWKIDNLQKSYSLHVEKSL